MSFFRYFATVTRLSLGRLCRQRLLPAGLALLCLLLSLGGGWAAERLLSRGVALGPITLALTAPAGDRTPRLLEQVMGGMEDVSQYCAVVAMDEPAALEALRSGQVTAVLSLPEDFIHAVMDGSNPDPRLIVSGTRPLESLLLLWVGRSAADILTAFQSGVYAVLEQYAAAPPPGLSWEQVVKDINLRYISLALDRSSFFVQEEVAVTRALPIALHYRLSLASYFALAAAPLFMGLYGGDWLRSQRRLRSVGRGCWTGLLGSVAAGGLALLLLFLPILLLSGRGHLPGACLAAAAMALFCSLFCALCCLAAGDAGRCGGLSFLLSLLSLVLAGGILPPALLPPGLSRWSWLSPVTWLCQLGGWGLGYAPEGSSLLCLALAPAVMAGACLVLYRRGVEAEEVA